MTSNYCPLPFKHVFVEPRGVKPCCSYIFLYPGTISEWLASDELKTLQQEMRDNKIPAGCDACIKNEKIDKGSTRLNALEYYQDTTFTKTDIDYVDYRTNNICNFRCRSCEPFFSNGIAAEVRRYPELEKFQARGAIIQEDNTEIFMEASPGTKLAAVAEPNYHWLIDNIHRISRLMFTGGEPTRIPVVREVIDYIIDNDIDINILITSNASFTDPYWFEITKKIKKIHWTLSLDAIGSNAEIIRDGTDWTVVSKNIETMFDISPSVNIGTVVTNLNVLHLYPLFKWINNLADKYHDRRNGRTQFVYACNWPKRMSPYNWPDNLKPLVLDYLQSIDLNLLVDQQLEIVKSLIENIKNTPFDAKLWEESEAYNNILDRTRNQNHQKLFVPTYGI